MLLYLSILLKSSSGIHLHGQQTVWSPEPNFNVEKMVKKHNT